MHQGPWHSTKMVQAQRQLLLPYKLRLRMNSLSFPARKPVLDSLVTNRQITYLLRLAEIRGRKNQSCLQNSAIKQYRVSQETLADPHFKELERNLQRLKRGVGLERQGRRGADLDTTKYGEGICFPSILTKRPNK